MTLKFATPSVLCVKHTKSVVSIGFWKKLPPGSNSSLASIYLAFLCKSDDMKTYGYCKIFEPLFQDFVTLEQQVVFVSQGKGGFVESFLGQYFCRFCTAQWAETQVKEVKSCAFTPRNKELHQVQ